MKELIAAVENMSESALKVQMHLFIAQADRANDVELEAFRRDVAAMMEHRLEHIEGLEPIELMHEGAPLASAWATVQWPTSLRALESEYKLLRAIQTTYDSNPEVHQFYGQLACQCLIKAARVKRDLRELKWVALGVRRPVMRWEGKELGLAQ